MSEVTLPGDAESPQRTEQVEDWSFVIKGGQSATYRIHVERGEHAVVVQGNPAQALPSTVHVLLKDGTDKNETVAEGAFIIHNLVSFFKEPKRVPIYAKGESPEEKELARVAEFEAQRAAAFEKRQAAKEADFLRELKES